MKIDICQKGSYQILKIEEDLNVISDLTELRFLIMGYLNQGKKYIAVSFTSANYIYSGAIAILIDCYKKVKEVDGELSIVESNPDIHNIFKFLHLDHFIKMYVSIDDLSS